MFKYSLQMHFSAKEHKSKKNKKNTVLIIEIVSLFKF